MPGTQAARSTLFLLFAGNWPTHSDTNSFETGCDPAADGTLPQTKVKPKLREIATERRRLTERFNTASADVTDSARLIQTALKFLETPDELYRRSNEQQRRLLNQAIFHGLYIEDDQITDHDLHEPFGQLHALQREHVPEPEAPRPRRRAAKWPPAQQMALQLPVLPSF
jgi:hypothetical protein